MQTGDKFPDFRLPDENGDIVDSKLLEGVRYIIYFYPKDNTSGCTAEAKDFSEICWSRGIVFRQFNWRTKKQF